jgi:hypothetical protein
VIVLQQLGLKAVLDAVQDLNFLTVFPDLKVYIVIHLAIVLQVVSNTVGGGGRCVSVCPCPCVRETHMDTTNAVGARGDTKQVNRRNAGR